MTKDMIDDLIDYLKMEAKDLRDQLGYVQNTIDQLEAIPPANTAASRAPTGKIKLAPKAKAPIEDASIISIVAGVGNGGISAGTIRETLPSETTGAALSGRLAKLVQSGALSKSGDRRATRYVVGQVPNP